jgi:cobalt-zinc-cadmium efflux system outer membrane protein
MAWWAAAGMVACAFTSRGAFGQDDACAVVRRDNLTACARARSYALRIEREDVTAAEGRRTAATPLLPSNPVASGNVAYREGGSGQPAVVNWQASLGQEVDLAGKRGARVDAADQKLARERYRATAIDRYVLAEAWTAYFEVLAADEAHVLAAELSATAASFVTAADARVEKGLAAPIDAQLALAAATHLEQQRIASQRLAVEARVKLAGALGLDRPGFQVGGALEPLRTLGGIGMATISPDAQPDVLALRSDARAEEARATLLRRERIPNPTVSLFAGREEFNQTFLGAGLSLPIPLPEPLGSTHSGEIAEAEARARRAALEAERASHSASLELAEARATYAARQEEAALFAPSQLARARDALQALAEEVAAARMPVREAVVAEQSLLDLLRSSVEARLGLCVASVELVRVSGLSFDPGAP